MGLPAAPHARPRCGPGSGGGRRGLAAWRAQVALPHRLRPIAAPRRRAAEGEEGGGAAEGRRRAPARRARVVVALAAAAASSPAPGDGGEPRFITADDCRRLIDAAALADASAGLTAPHPNAACVLVSPGGGGVVGAAFLRAQGTTASEELAASAAGPSARGSTAYLNLESGSDCVGDDAAVRALVGAGVARVVVGLRHPLPHLRGRAVAALRRAGVRVDVLGETPVHPALAEEARRELLWYQQQALLQQRARGGGGGAATAAGATDALAAQVAAAEAAAQREAAVAAALAAGPGRPAPTELLLAAAGAAGGAGAAAATAAATAAAATPTTPPAADQAPPLLLTPPDPDAPTPRAALLACLRANEALIHRAVTGAPFSVLKYAMTLDGKIAASSGHSAWVSSPAARAVVFEVRARSDAVVVGGNTVRRDDPRLTTRRQGGHSPARVVMSRTLDLPEKAALWDVALAPTIVMTQRGARPDAQRALRARGVEVVEFDFLHPRDVARYCAERGFLQVLWECGGKLAAPAIAAGVVHKVVSFVAPKIVGGERAPTPVGELGNVQMTQASALCDVTWRPVGPDLMATGYLPSSGGLLALEAALSRPGRKRAAAAAAAEAAEEEEARAVAAAAAAAGCGEVAAALASSSPLVAPPLRNLPGTQRVITFYKSWDEWGALSNFSPHPVEIGEGDQEEQEGEEEEEEEQEGQGAGAGAGDAAAAAPAAPAAAASTTTTTRLWPSVEHYYQSQKFAATRDHTPSAEALELAAAIANAPSPEEAARLGRRAERERPELVRPDWPRAKRNVMLRALRAKFRAHAGPRGVLLSTAGAELAAGTGVAGALRTVEEEGAEDEEEEDGARAGGHGHGAAGGALLLEASPHDRYWGQGFDGTGGNALGELLMKVRAELLREEAEQQQRASAASPASPQRQQHHHHHNGPNGSSPSPSSGAAASPARPQAAATR